MARNEQSARQRAINTLAAFAKRGRLSDDLPELADQFNNESDRGIVVLMGSLLEDLLFERLKGAFIPLSGEKLKKLGRGPLGTFDARIGMAHALGLIDERAVDMLHVIRALRNACAHSRLDIRFSTPELRDTLALLFDDGTASLIRSGELSARSLRLRFLVSYIVLGNVLKGIAFDDAQRRGAEILRGLEEQRILARTRSGS